MFITVKDKMNRLVLINLDNVTIITPTEDNTGSFVYFNTEEEDYTTVTSTVEALFNQISTMQKK